MANIKSAKKRILTNDRQRSENRYVKATISTYIKGFRKLLADGKFADAEKKLISTISYIDSARSKGILHKNNASRKIARLTTAYTQAVASAKVEAPVKEVKKAEVKVVKAETKTEEVKEVKKTTKKAATKKATEEKPAKKTTAKKTTKKEEK